MSKVVSIVNQKGGVGKTTTAVNLATALAAIGKKILLIDLDPQGNASTGLGFTQADRDLTTYDLLSGEASVAQAAKETKVPNLRLVPSTMDLAGAELELVNAEARQARLKTALEESVEAYDFIFIDCPPSLGLLTLNSLVASNMVLIPLQCEFYALEGLAHLLKTVEMVKSSLNAELEIQGIVLTMYDRRNKLTEQIESDVREFLGDQVYQTTIPRNVRISEAPSHGKPALIYDLNCPGSQAYARLAAEVLTRENKRHATCDVA